MEPIGRPKGLAMLVVAATMFITGGCGVVCPAGVSPGIAPAAGASAGWHYEAPTGLKQTWCRFTASGHWAGRIGRVLLFLALALPVSLIAFAIGVVLLPLEIVVFAIATLTSKNLFWLTMIVTWKYALLFHAIF